MTRRRPPPEWDRENWQTGWAYRNARERYLRQELANEGVAPPTDASPEEVWWTWRAWQDAKAGAERDRALRRYEREGAPPPDEPRWAKDAEKALRPPCAEAGLDCPGSPHTARCRDRRRNQRARLVGGV